MEPAVYVDAIVREGQAVLAAGKAGLDAPVPTCKGWVVADVLGHLGRVHRSVSEILERRAREIPDVAIPKSPAGDAVLGFFEEGLERLVAALSAVEPDAIVYTWSGPSEAIFYHRRMAHEVAVHRYDAEAAHGTPSPFEPELAADAIDELYSVVLPFAIRRWNRPLPAGSMHLHRTDGAGEWLVRIDDRQLTVAREHAKGDVAVRGSASDLLAFAWNRGRSDSLEVFGPTELADAWAGLAP
jgi:uncharacterized protein (TIGR03083 family)